MRGRLEQQYKNPKFFSQISKTQLKPRGQKNSFDILKPDVPPGINNKPAKIGANNQVLMQQSIKVDVDQVDWWLRQNRCVVVARRLNYGQQEETK